MACVPLISPRSEARFASNVVSQIYIERKSGLAEHSGPKDLAVQPSPATRNPPTRFF